MSSLSDFAATAGQWRSWALMAQQDISLRYKRSVLGPLWISIALGITSLGVGLLYSAVFGLKATEFIRFLAVGFMTWSFIQALLTEGSAIVVEAAGHLRSVIIPVPVLAARMVWRNVIVLAHNLVLVLCIIALTYVYEGQDALAGFKPIALLAALGILTIAAIGYFLAIVLGPFCARFRDVSQIIANFLQLVFLMTPIFWRPDQVGERVWIRDWNPFYHVIELVRAPLLGTYPLALNWMVAGGVLAGVALLALLALPMTRDRVGLWI